MKKITKYKSNSKILLVEDDSVTRKKLKSILSKTYFNIIEAKNGEEALELYKNALLFEDEKIDLILSDINMPLTNGIELLESVREIDDFIPFVFITAKVDLESVLKVVKLDISDYIIKPIVIVELLESIDKTLKKRYKKEFIKLEDDILKLLNGYTWKSNEKSLYLNDDIVKLTKNEIILLDLLCHKINNIINIEHIIYEIWEDSFHMESCHSNLKNLISRLRFKQPFLEIESVYGLGYRIKEEI
jgi:DNA-binding response OmpR family regulator